MNCRLELLPILLAVSAACGDSARLQPLIPAEVELAGGSGQTAAAGSLLSDPLRVLVRDSGGNPAAGVTVSWSVVAGGGTTSPPASTTGPDGIASAGFTLGASEGEQRAQAEVSGLAGSPVVFTATAIPTSGRARLRVIGGGNNVPDRFSSDLWVHGNYAYTGTWGNRGGNVGNVLEIWSIGTGGSPTAVGSLTNPDIGIVSDVQGSDDGQLLVYSGERGTNGGIYLYGLADPTRPVLRGSAEVGLAGVHTVSLSTIAGRLYAFAARNPGPTEDSADDPALLIYDVTDAALPSLVARVPVPRTHGIHDTFVRDGLVFAFVWNAGVIIYDVGNGVRGGSPGAPVEVSRLITSANGVSGGPAVHNGWWFHNPVTKEQRYLFVGQEGAGIIGSRSSGDIHVVDVSDLAHPREVAFFHLNGAGSHNFWMDEQAQILYAAYYNGGVVALDVSGTLAGNLSERLVGQVQPGGDGNTFTWGVQLANGFLYAIDMLSGLWQLSRVN